jgi:hypothetical protein
MADDATKTDPSLLGAILVRNFGLPLKTLQVALDWQRQSEGLLGEVLVEMEAVTTEQLDAALAQQDELRREVAAEVARVEDTQPIDVVEDED